MSASWHKLGSASDGTALLREFRVWKLLECGLGKARSQAPFLGLGETVVLVPSMGKEMSVAWGWSGLSRLGPAQLRASVCPSAAMP